MKKILSMFDSLRPADLVTIACVFLIGAFLFVTVTGCGSSLSQDRTENKNEKDPTLIGALWDLHCKNNLKQIKIALIMYETSFARLPDRGGDLFLAKLYLTGYITDWDVFICPADAEKDGAGFVMAEISEKCPPPDGKWHEYDEYIDEDYDGEMRQSRYFLDREREWKMSVYGDDVRTFKPGEISYAAVWNRHGSEYDDELESNSEWRKEYERKSISSTKRMPLVCDDFEGADGKANTMIHGDHVNVLYTNGDIDSVSDLKTIGEDSNIRDFRALRN